LANALGPLLIAFLYRTYGYGSVFVYIAACWLVVAVTVTATGPQTRGRTL
jgi:MFS transporter, putative metabolite:H+ symporter